MLSQDDRWISADQVARQCHVDKRTVHRWVRRYGLECEIRDGQKMINASSLEELLNRATEERGL